MMNKNNVYSTLNSSEGKHAGQSIFLLTVINFITDLILLILRNLLIFCINTCTDEWVLATPPSEFI